MKSGLPLQKCAPFSLYISVLFLSTAALFPLRSQTGYNKNQSYIEFNSASGSYFSGSFLQNNFIEHPDESTLIYLDDNVRRNVSILDDIYKYIYVLQKEPAFKSDSLSFLYEYGASNRFSAGYFADMNVLRVGNSSYVLPSENYWFYYYKLKTGGISSNNLFNYYLAQKNSFISGPVPYGFLAQGIHAGYHFKSGASFDPYIRFYAGGGKEIIDKMPFALAGIASGLRYFMTDNLFIKTEAGFYNYSILARKNSPLSMESDFTTHSGTFRTAAVYAGIGLNLDIFKKINFTSNKPVQEAKERKEILNEFELIKEKTGIEFEEQNDSIRLRLPDEIVFDAGSEKVSVKGEKVLLAIGKILQYSEKKIRIEGHTDSMPIKSKKYKNNYELALGRADSVKSIMEKAGVQSSRMKTVSHGPDKPLRENNSDDGRKANRRIEMFILYEKSPHN